MARRFKPIPVRALRRGLIFFLVFFVVGVSGLYWFGRERPVESLASNEPERGSSKDRDALVSGRGFDYTVSIGDTRLFRIKAKRYRSNDEKSYEFEDVEIEWDREDGSSYLLEASEGTFDQEATEATVTGDVLFRSSSGLVLRSQGLNLVSRGRLIISTAPVDFELDERYTGRANQLRLRVRKSILYLAGDVLVESKQPVTDEEGVTTLETDMQLSCQSLSYEEKKLTIRADGSVVLTQGESGLAGRRLSLLLDETDRSILFLQARWGVHGTFVRSSDEGQQQVIDFASNYMSTQFHPDTEHPRTIELEGGHTEPAEFEVRETGLPTRRLTSQILQIDFEEGKVAEAQSLAPLEMLEYEDPKKPQRIARGDSAEALFDSDGELSQMTLTGSIVYRDLEVNAEGDVAVIDNLAQTIVLDGTPARLESDRGTIEAPTIRRDEAAGSVVASEPVRANLNPSSDGGLAGSALGRARTPVQVQATEARWLDGESRFAFSGNVRAWQGDSLLIAEEVEGRTDSEFLTAKGAVKTIWEASPDDENSRGPIEVTADEMEYSKPNGVLSYQGSSRIHQDGKIVFCEDVKVFLDEEDELRAATCEGDTVIRDPAAGRTIKGDSANYQIATGTIEVEGTPVTLKEGNASEIKGPRLIYFLDEDRAQILGERVAIGEEAEEIERAKEEAEAELKRRQEELAGESDDDLEEASDDGPQRRRRSASDNDDSSPDDRPVPRAQAKESL